MPGTSSHPDPLARNNVHVIGNPNATRTLVFVHGIGTDQGAWHAVAAAFERDWRIVLLDNVGAGASDSAAFVSHRYLNLQRYSEDLVEVLKALKLRDCVLVGHSVGAMICALASIASPGLASRLVLLGGSPRYLADEGYPGAMTADHVRQIYETATQKFPEWAGSFAAMAMQNPDRPSLSADFAHSLTKVPLDRLLAILCSALQTDYRAELAKIAVPTLILQAKDDAFVPIGVAEFMRDAIRGARLEIIEATGHLPHVSAPERVVAALRDFVCG